MTRKRIDDHGTQFGDWIRKQPEVDSAFGYTATDLDYVWRNHKNKNWMIIEEKRKMATMRKAQCKSHSFLNNVCKNNANYFGFHLLQFEETSPQDGRIYWNTHEVTRDEFIYKLEMIDKEPGYFELAAKYALTTQSNTIIL